MISRPDYFDAIRRRAEQRWDQLDNDPELAGPWHLLFKQVQSPRHVLSELLQNADDAGATEATVRIDDGVFTFAHNGEDFTKEHFASLCSFGYSNKRVLHTIGFRGIGFKSTFSLGDTVELHTPTLSISFHRDRFTEPHWMDTQTTSASSTVISVAICDGPRQEEVEKNLQEWLLNPVSLLFFSHIKHLQIGDRVLHWDSLGPGPLPDTEWMALNGDPNDAYLVVKSPEEEFPPEAVAEIRQERLLGVSQDAALPPCRIEIVLGATGRLYVVLPTGVETSLPFACNAPFIQDPARMKIKDPEISLTNRWLLKRVGSLAASVMLRWLERTDVSIADRSLAYGFIPDVNVDGGSIEAVCATAARKAFETAIRGQAFLLTNTGELRTAGHAVAMPEELFDVWSEDQVSALLDGDGRPALSRAVSEADRAKLVSWRAIGTIGKSDVISVLRTKRLPKPGTWLGLLRLWNYVASEIAGYWNRRTVPTLRFLPVQGKDVLYAANEIVRLGERRLLQKDSDWDFLAEHLLVLNPNWPRFLTDQRREAEEQGHAELLGHAETAYAILNSIGLSESSNANTVIDQVAQGFFAKQPISLAACVQLAQITAKLGATAGPAFRFVTQDRRLRACDWNVVYDVDGTLEALLPDSWCSTHLLHPEYTSSFSSCSSEEWARWVLSGRAGIHAFPPLASVKHSLYGRQRIRTELDRRSFTGEIDFPYVGNSFAIDDWDFEQVIWEHWTALAADDPKLWGMVAERILAQPEAYWAKSKSAGALQAATNGNRKAITSDPVLPTWILKLRDLACLPDTRGFYHKPCDLLRRTQETEPLMDVEPFIRSSLDTESSRPLLELLGVRATPMGPDGLLRRLRALSRAETPPAHDVERWYGRLDQMLDTCPTADFNSVKQAFWEENLVLTEDHGWTNASGVYLSADEEDVPGAAVIRASVSGLSLWRKLGIAERPTADLAVEWLKGLPSGGPLAQNDLRRVRALSARHAVRVWNECGHWLNLAGGWAPVADLQYAMTMQTLVPWSHFHQWVKQQTADLQRLPVETTAVPPFSELQTLSDHIEDRLRIDSIAYRSPERRPWLNQMGTELGRVQLEDEAATVQIRALASRLAETVWQVAPGIETVPYIRGIPAGTPRRTEVAWIDRVLYVDDLPNAKLARLVPENLGKVFNDPGTAAALSYCFGRSTEEVTEYLEANFRLVPRVPAADPAVAEEGKARTDAGADPQHLAEDRPGEHGVGDANAVADVECDAKAETQDGPAQDVEPFPARPDGAEVMPARPAASPKPVKPSIISRFALSLGFQKDGGDRFFHPDGRWIAKADDSRFPWEMRTADGVVVRRYQPIDHCLEQQPLQLGADTWGMIDLHPDTHALILVGVHGSPVEMDGTRLRAMRDSGMLVLYPAAYRLVCKGYP